MKIKESFKELIRGFVLDRNLFDIKDEKIIKGALCRFYFLIVLKIYCIFRCLKNLGLQDCQT